MLTAQRHLENMFKQDKSPPELLGWVDENVGSVPADPIFARWLLRTVLEKTFPKGKNIDKKDLEPYAALLHKFIDVNPTKKGPSRGGDLSVPVACLFEVQAFCFRQKTKGLILKIFEALYELQLIPAAAYAEWSDDTRDETPGKQDLLVQCSKWLTWLETADDEGDEEEEEEGEEEVGDGDE